MSRLMVYQRTCKVCRAEFEAARANAEYCGDAHRQQATRDRARARAQEKRPREGFLSKATKRELAEAGELESSAGQKLLLLARRIENGERESGSSLSSLILRHDRLMDVLRSRTVPKGDLVDEVRAKREQRAARAR